MTDTIGSHYINNGGAVMSTARRASSSGQPQRRRPQTNPQGDPELVNRLKRAIGAYQMRTGDSITWKEMAGLVDLTPSSMTDVLSAKKRVTIEEARIWSKKLGVEFAWLAIGEGPMIAMTPEELRRYGAAPEEGESAAAFFTRRRVEAQKQPPRAGSKGR